MSNAYILLDTPMSFPTSVNTLINSQSLTVEQVNEVVKLQNELWHNFLLENSKIDLFHLYQRWNDDDLLQQVFLAYDQENWVICEFASNSKYAYATLNRSKILEVTGWTEEQLLEHIKKYKGEKYFLSTKCPEKIVANKVTLPVAGNRKVLGTNGLSRLGLAYTGQNPVKFDLSVLNRYYPKILLNSIKGLNKITDKEWISQKSMPYHEVVKSCLDYLIDNNPTIYGGQGYCDSRGRFYLDWNKRVFNPSTFKEALSLVRCPEKGLTISGEFTVYLAIAELAGLKASNWKEKHELGKMAYQDRLLPETPLITSPSGCQYYNNLHERIWLERLYNGLEYHYSNPEYIWDIPVEIDAIASGLQMVGVLTNDPELLDGTNLICPDILKDIWTVEGVQRILVKKTITPKLFGSSQSLLDLIDNVDIKYSQKELKLLQKSIDNVFKKALKFSEFLVTKCNPEKNLNSNGALPIKILEDEFRVLPTRFRNRPSLEEHWIYSSADGLAHRVCLPLYDEPDFQQWKRYFATGLIHNLDSQVAEFVAITCYNHNRWLLTNHDAFLCHPNDGTLIRSTYTEKMYYIWQHRKEILSQYFRNIGIDSSFEFASNEKFDKFYGTALK